MRFQLDLAHHAATAHTEKAVPMLGPRAVYAFVDDLDLLTRVPDVEAVWWDADVQFRNAIRDFTCVLDNECTELRVEASLAGAEPRAALLHREVLQGLQAVWRKPSPAITVRQLTRLIVGETPTGSTVGRLLRSDLVGIWQDRDDIADSLEFARQLRRQAETRGHG